METLSIGNWQSAFGIDLLIADGLSSSHQCLPFTRLFPVFG
ncbi:MAG: hypothetical protein QOD75_1947 [Blastocatellia bacterium]|jgi:hypothetical protein|nr:hypothetical protein [Blastocatellia bacterium]